MSILPQLIAIYRNGGFEPLTGYNPYHFENYMDAPFTKFVKDNTVMGCAGLALQEVMFVEHFSSYLSPKNILVIGNAHGWSTIALSLTFPEAKVVAIDPGKEGNDVTNQLAQFNHLDVTAIEGFSPQDVGPICTEHFDGPVDLVLIDAIHTNEAVLVDFAACKPHAHEGTVYVFHDVINWRMVDAIHKIKAEHGMEGHILTRTPSGMAVLWQEATPEFKEYIGAFCEPPEFFRQVRKFILEVSTQSSTQTLEKL